MATCRLVSLSHARGGGPRARLPTRPSARTFTLGGVNASSSARRRLDERITKKRSSSVKQEETTIEDVNELELRATLKAIGLELQDCVDTGSYAAVFKAVSVGDAGAAEGDRSWQGEAGKVFAVKILLNSMVNEDSVRDFRREALLLGRVDHPGIIKMHHFGKSPQSFMVGGGNLWNAIRCERVKVSSASSRVRDDAGQGLETAPENMPLLDLPSIAGDVARALAYLHGAGFAHRDVKSTNVLLAWCPEKQRVQAKLCDFGSAAPVGKMPRRPSKPQWGGLEKWLGFSGRWQPVGTMLWMAPEMLEPPVEGAEPPDGYSGDKVDVYSLGVVLWELMEWRVPWAEGKDISKQEVVDSVVRRRERLPIPSGCDDRLAGLMASMWAVSPGERPSASRVVEELERAGTSWDVSGHFSRVARAANESGEEVVQWLATSTAERRAQETLDNEEILPSPGSPPPSAEDEKDEKDEASSSSAAAAARHERDAVSGSETTSPSPEAATAADGESSSGASTGSATPDDSSKFSADGAESSSPEPHANGFGAVGSVTLEDLNKLMVPMLFPHVFASVVSASDRELLEEQRAELAALERTAEELKARSKMDPFAAFTADAKRREAGRLRKRVSLAAAEEKVNAWRATRDVLREQLLEAETQHREWRRKYREIERGG